MVTIGWCKSQKKGIKLIEPNDNLANEYILTAEETLDVLKSIKGKSKVWLSTTKYYCEYFTAYSLLMKLGIKCEIHDCTILVCELLEAEGLFPEGFSKRLAEDKQLRIDNQYYLKNRDVPITYSELLNLVLSVKDTNNRITPEKIKEIRDKL